MSSDRVEPSAAAPRASSEEALIDSLYLSLRRFAAVSAPPEIDPDDLVQQALVNALQSRPLMAYENLGGYLRTTITNLLRNHHRTKGRVIPLRDGAAGRIDSYPSDLALLGTLAALDRAALFLVDVERCSYKEAASILGCSPGALRARTVRARRRLQAEVNSEDR